jgi:hypothetical protein
VPAPNVTSRGELRRNMAVKLSRNSSLLALKTSGDYDATIR